MSKEVLSTRVTNTIIEYVEKAGGNVAELLDGLPYSKKYLTSTYNWVAQNTQVILLDRAERILGDKDVARKIGRYSASPQVLGMLSTIVRLLSGPAGAYENGARFVPYFNRNQKGRYIPINNREGIFELHNIEKMNFQLSICEYSAGIVEGVPVVFGLPPGRVVMETCFIGIDEAGKIGGFFYGVDDQGEVTAYYDEAHTASAGVRGRLDPDGTFMVGGVRYGAKSCRYHVTFETGKSAKRSILDRLLAKRFSTYIEDLDKANAAMEERFDELKKQELRKERYSQLAMALVDQRSLKDMLSLVATSAVEIGELISARIYLLQDENEMVQADGAMAIGDINQVMRLKKVYEKWGIDPSNLDVSKHPATKTVLYDGIPVKYTSLIDGMGHFWPSEACDELQKVGGLNELALLPLRMRGEPLGIMLAGSSGTIDLEALVPLTNMAAQAIWNFRRIEQMRKEKENLERFRDIQLAMTEKRDLDELLNFIAKSALDVTSSVILRIILVNHQQNKVTKEIVAKGADGPTLIGDILANLPDTLKTFEGLTSAVDNNLFALDFTNNRVVHYDGLRDFLNGILPLEVCNGLEHEYGIKEMIAVPLETEGEITGFIKLISTRKLDDNLILMLAGQAGQAIREAQYVEEIRDHRDNLERLVWDRTVELENKNRTLAETQTHMLQQEKMAGLGQLVAGIAHEINNPISYVYSNLNTLQEYAQDMHDICGMVEEMRDVALKSTDEKVYTLAAELEKAMTDKNAKDILKDIKEVVEESLDGARRVKEIVQNLKEFSRPGEKKHSDADLNTGIESTLMVLRNELKYKVNIHKDLETLPYLKCYPHELNQVFMNLILNAAQSIPVKGDIWISSKRENGSIRVAVEDNGAGIAPDHLNKIFEPFFTTKDVGSGTGLGLTISYGIVRRHGGLIEVKSEQGKGSRFTVVLPVGGEPVATDTEELIEELGTKEIHEGEGVELS